MCLILVNIRRYKVLRIGETKDIQIAGFYGLKSMMYSLIRKMIKETKKQDELIKMLSKNESLRICRHTFEKKLGHEMSSKSHQIGAYKTMKISLSCFRDKRDIDLIMELKF